MLDRIGAFITWINVDRVPKFAFTAADRARTRMAHAGRHFSGGSAASCCLFSISNSVTPLRNRGRSFLALVVYAAATITVWVFYDFTQQYMTVASVVSGILLLLGMLGVVLVLLAEAYEWAEAHWVTSRCAWGRQCGRTAIPTPKVSIHVPAYNEPPDMVIETLDALARLDYSNFEVLVIDNNTRDAAVWHPVEAHCAQLGERFRFFHVAPLAGFKAGALKFRPATHRGGRADRGGDRQRLRGRAQLVVRARSRLPGSPHCHRPGHRRTIATKARAPSRRCVTPNIAGSSTSA